jgi:hypothetical protein
MATREAKQLTEAQIAAWREYQRTGVITAEIEQQLEGVRLADVEALELPRLKQFARDTAHINPGLLHDIEIGMITPHDANVMRHVEAYYAARALREKHDGAAA